LDSHGAESVVMNVRETRLPVSVHRSIVLEDSAPMARIDLLNAENAPISTQSYFEGGDPGPIVAALANVPELVGPTLGFVGAALGEGAVTTRHKEFAILRTSALQGCQYCIHTHSSVAIDVGLSTDEIRALRGEMAIEDAFPKQSEQRLIRWIDAMAGATGPVPTEVWEAARASFAEHLLIELCVTIGATMFLNRFATGFDLPASTATLERLADAGLR
jgi:AhpD family alkylhydroperoxidase